MQTDFKVESGLISNNELSRLRLQRQGLSIVPGHNKDELAKIKTAARGMLKGSGILKAYLK